MKPFLSFIALSFISIQSWASETTLDLPASGVLVKALGHGNIIIHDKNGKLSIIIIPHNQQPHAGPSFSMSRQGVYGEPEITWTVKQGDFNYVAIQKKTEEQLPARLVAFSYINGSLGPVNVKKFRYSLMQDSSTPTITTHAPTKALKSDSPTSSKNPRQH